MLDNLFDKERQELESLEAPQGLEDLLRARLGEVPNKEKNKGRYLKIASVLILALIISGLNSNTIAGYLRPKKQAEIKGFDQLTTGNMKEMIGRDLVEEIGEDYIFSDGSKVRLEGILVDRQGVNIFVGLEDDFNINVNIMDKKSIKKNHSGQGIRDGDSKRMNWVFYTQLKPEDDFLIMEIFQDGSSEKAEFKFGIDRDNISNEYKNIKISKTVKIDGHRYRLKDIQITPMNMVLRGASENIIELGLRSLLGHRKPKPNWDVDLEVNGQVVLARTSSFTSDMGGSYFEYRFDEFPIGEINDLNIIIKSFDDQLILKRLKIK